MSVKHLILTGPKEVDKEKAAHAVLSMLPTKYTMRLGANITLLYLVKFRELPYLKMLFFNNVENEAQIVQLTKDVGMINKNASIIFTCDKPCMALKKDNRYNIIEVA